ncbi:hypothetical protein [Actinomadura fibrosa]|uniref:hypothetical protein n=1 Tax=Actinomadura fibrosa TaxID=111802 RepID=UPI0036707A6D
MTRHLRDDLNEIAAEVAREIAARVPAYGHVRNAAVAGPVRDALSVCAGGQDRLTALDAFRRLGAREARAGQDVRHLESALRAGARVLIGRTASTAARIYPPTTEFVSVMETAFTAEKEIVTAAVEGHAEAARPTMTRRLRTLLSRPRRTGGRPARSARSASSGAR